MPPQRPMARRLAADLAAVQLGAARRDARDRHHRARDGCHAAHGDCGRGEGAWDRHVAPGGKWWEIRMGRDWVMVKVDDG